MSSMLLKMYDCMEPAAYIPEFVIEKFNKERYFSMASMICGDCGVDCGGCDSEGGDYGCGCNA